MDVNYLGTIFGLKNVEMCFLWNIEIFKADAIYNTIEITIYSSHMLDGNW